MVNKNSSGFAI